MFPDHPPSQWSGHAQTSFSHEFIVIHMLCHYESRDQELAVHQTMTGMAAVKHARRDD